jgi:hypothetical protein
MRAKANIQMGMVVISHAIAVCSIAQALSAHGTPTGEGGKTLEHAFSCFADGLAWWVEATKTQRARKRPPYLGSRAQ